METDIKLLVQIIIYFCIFVCGFAISTPVGIASLKETIHKAFSHRNYGSKCVALGYNSTYFSNKFKKVRHATPRNK